MNIEQIRQKVVSEIKLIPDDKLTELYDFVHFFRLGIETKKSVSKNEIMQLAGCWKDMPAEIFNDFLKEITQRRNQAFKRRRINGSSHD